MASNTFDVFIPVLLMMLIAAGIFGGAILVSWILAPTKPSKLKSQPYECGEEPVGSAWSAFNVRFYVVGLIFIIFDVESVLMFPVVAVFKKVHEMGHGAYALIIFLSFISVLLEGIAYVWKKGDLDWVKSYKKPKNITAIPSSKTARTQA